MVSRLRPSDDELAIVTGLQRILTRKSAKADEFDKAYRGVRQVEMIGMAAPEGLRRFEFPLNWARVTVDSVADRQDVKSLHMPGEEEDSENLREAWEMNDMPSQSNLLHRETLIHGYGFVSVSTNPDDAEHPLITVESSRGMAARVHPAKRTIEAALRVYKDPWVQTGPEYATLYQPNATVWLSREHGSAWHVDDRDDHELGRVPVVMAVNRQRAGDWLGESEMADVIGPMDMATRTLMNLQVAMEIAAIPRRWAVNVSKEAFVDVNGNPKDKWDAAMDTVWAVMGKPGQEPKFGQFDAADPKGFVEVITMLAEQCSSITGLPVRYFGQNTVNPAAEGAIRADEWRLVKNVERKNRNLGDVYGDILALYERIRTGEWIPSAERIATEWYDAATPTLAQRADAIQKLAGGKPILSTAGAWDELEWSEARKKRERAYLDAEAVADPELRLAAGLISGSVY